MNAAEKRSRLIKQQLALVLFALDATRFFTQNLTGSPSLQREQFHGKPLGARKRVRRCFHKFNNSRLLFRCCAAARAAETRLSSAASNKNVNRFIQKCSRDWAY